MKALVFDKSKTRWKTSRGFEMAEVSDPVIEKDDEVIIKVKFAGVCGTDKSIWYRQALGEQILRSLAEEGRDYRIIGHEVLGEVVEVGSRVTELYKIKKGDFVSCESHVVCNECFQCKLGQKNVCSNERILGMTYDGGFAEYLKVPGHIVWPMDLAKIRPEVAAIQDPFGNAMHAASKVDLRGKIVAIFGLGSIGLFTLLIARAGGAKTIIGIEPNPVSQEMAKKLGIDYVIPLKIGSTSPGLSTTLPRPGEGLGERSQYVHDEEVVGEIMRITNGLGVDVAFEMAGQNSAFNNAIFSTRRGGDVILFGIKAADFVVQDYDQLIIRGLTLHAVIGREIWETWETTKKLLEDQSNGIQEKVYKVILNEGKGTILPISEYTKDRFEEMLSRRTKILLQF